MEGGEGVAKHRMYKFMKWVYMQKARSDKHTMRKAIACACSARGNARAAYQVVPPLRHGGSFSSAVSWPRSRARHFHARGGSPYGACGRTISILPVCESGWRRHARSHGRRKSISGQDVCNPCSEMHLEHGGLSLHTRSNKAKNVHRLLP